MAWFDLELQFDKAQIRIGHFTDCHLFATPCGEYFAVNTATNLKRTLAAMAKEHFDCVVFGGDLTQESQCGFLSRVCPFSEREWVAMPCALGAG